MNNSSKVLLIQTAFIGDVILATSLIEKLRKFYPGIKIDFLLRNGNENILEGNPGINEIIIWDKSGGKYLNMLKVIRRIRKNRYNHVINLQRYFSTGLITVLSGSKNKTGFNKNPLSAFFDNKVKHIFGDGKHEIERNHKLIESFTDETLERPCIYPEEEYIERIHEQFILPYLTISPSSVWFTKQFPKDKWINFINSVGDIYHIYLLGSKKDKIQCDEIILDSENKKIISMAGKLSLLESAAVMKFARMNYVNDSAPLHLASATNSPVTAIFCSTLPDFGFGPLSDHSFIIETKEKLNCRPCGIHGRRECKTKNFDCARTIDNNDLLSIVQ